MTIAENLFLGREVRRAGFAGSVLRMLDKKRMVRESAAHMAALQIGVGSMTQSVETLSGGQRRRLACARVPFMSGRHPDLGRDAARGLGPQDLVPGDVLLARTTPRPLTRYDGATPEDLATPDAPRLGPLHRAGQALHPDRAVRAEGLGQFQLAVMRMD